jgi:hypothetical protein
LDFEVVFSKTFPYHIIQALYIVFPICATRTAHCNLPQY